MATTVALDNLQTLRPIRTSNRILAFDFTKGALVLFMVLYHWLNYFYAVNGKIYIYLRFLTPSFIFITGFLISHVHISKYGIGNPLLPKRLFLRGLKLLGVFVVLNLLISLLFAHSDGGVVVNRFSWPNLYAIFVTGNVFVDRSGKAAAFAILVPISYLLMASAFILILCRFFKYSFHVICGLLLLSIAILSGYGIHSLNLEHLTIGLLGIVFGYASGTDIRKVAEHPYAIMLAYCAYLTAITLWDVPFGLRMVGVVLSVALIYMVGASSGEPGKVRQHIIILGKYSLFGYISQIAILQVLHRGLSHLNLRTEVLVISFVAGFALTMISVELVDRIRPRSVSADRLYRAVFA
jgi:hypothetical protein